MSEIVVFSNVDSQEKAESIALKLVENRLAACVNIIPNIKSIYRWEGGIQNESESTMIIKTVDEKYDDLEKAIKELSGYEVPEIIAVDIKKGLKEYLGWLNKECV